MKRLVMFTLLIFSVRSAYSQNLVPNPGFETVDCKTSAPFQGCTIERNSPWVSPTNGDPDSYNICHTAGIFGNQLWSVPDNDFGLQAANSGVGYAGFYAWEALTPGSGYREYIQTELTSPLVAGETYHVSFFFSLSDDSNHAVDGIGAFFSNQSFSFSTTEPLPATPQVVSPDVITNKTGWEIISATYTAQGGERFITIGNFFDDDNTTVLTFDQSGFVNQAYYYIDDVVVEPATALPVELLVFDARHEGEYVRTNWTANSETNNDFYAVLRSKDGVSFEQIGTVEGSGNSNSERNYVFYDDHPYSGVSYYKLRQVDFDGTETISEVVSVYSESVSLINVYPNPAVSELFILIGAKSAMEVNVEVITTAGRLVLQRREYLQEGLSTLELNVSYLSSGQYIVRITTPFGEHVEREFIKGRR
jgi:hypothetical protein